MKRNVLFPAIAAALLLVACQAHHKSILIYANSDIQVDESGKGITVGDGTTHHEQQLEFTGGEPVTLNVTAPGGKYTLEAKDDGYYIVNLKKDTVVGSQQHIGEAGTGEEKITIDQLKHNLDSLQLLVAGQNVSASKHNFFIPPGRIQFLTKESPIRVFGPHTTVPGAFDAGSVKEIYKFYTVPEVREIIAKLTKMTALPGEITN